ncbi:MAG: S-adenosylmethionine:tRNA ribosyltransferase-isomerase [Bacteroidales bacterium]|nr:S-adenosylmethionine:tRNA ribosyltransferase-isomerase [Bacteroidales bacterium]
MDLAKKISIQDYHYQLPDSRIAKYPLPERDQSKLLIWSPHEAIRCDRFVNIGNHLPTGCLLVFNNTKVIYARIFFRKETGAEIEIFCLKPFNPADYSLIFQTRDNCNWECMVGNSRKWKGGLLQKELIINQEKVILSARKISALSEGIWNIQFAWDKRQITFAGIIESTGEVPIPPYLKRKAEESDKTSYQTVYSKINGSVAAPTAGLHFTAKVFDSLRSRHIQTTEITLHVGAGTFQQVKSAEVSDHRMHSEEIMVSVPVLRQLIQHAGNIVATGTTSVRALESIYWLGIKLIQGYFPRSRSPLIGQWESYRVSENISPSESLSAVIEHLGKIQKDHLEITTQLMIIPGYEFRMTKGMITNFHQPGSTLLLLVAAFTGKAWSDIYQYALDNDFRFLSYGDSSLLLKQALSEPASFRS